MSYSYNDTLYNAKIDALYKYVAEGWSVTMAESKAGLNNNKCFLIYKRSEHFERVRRIVKGNKYYANQKSN